MGYAVRLRFGARRLNLSSLPFYVSAGFTPPTGVGGRFTVPFGVFGDSQGEVSLAIDRVQEFLRLAEEDSGQLFLDWKFSPQINLESTWGQRSAYRSAEVLSGKVFAPSGYPRHLPSLNLECEMDLSLIPGIQGVRRRAATAGGTVIQDWAGVPHRRSRGIQIVSGDTTGGNHFKNPIFNHPTTWDTGWTDDAGIILTQNQDPRYILWGLNSAKIVGITTDEFTESINVGNTGTYRLSTHIRLWDDSVPTSSNCKLYYNTSALTPSFAPIGDGWYRCWATVTGVASAVRAGIQVQGGTTLFTTGFMLQEAARLTPFFYGDLPGCYWAGVPFESKSYRNGGFVYLRNGAGPSGVTYLDTSGTVVVVWIAGCDSSEMTENGFVFQEGSLGVEAWWNYSDNTWRFRTLDVAAPDQTAISAVTSWVRGEKIVFHFVYSPTELVKIYKNGSLLATSEFYSQPIDPPLTCYIGSSVSKTNYLPGTYGAFIPYPDGMSAAEVAEDYTDLAPLLADDVAIDPILYMYTGNGDDTVENEDSGTNENFIVLAGVHGDSEAFLEMRLVPNVNDEDIYLSSLPVLYDSYLDPEYLSYVPTSAPDAVSIGTSDTTICTISLDSDENRLLAGKDVMVMLRADEDNGGNNLRLRTAVIMGGGTPYYSWYYPSSWRIVSTDKSIDSSPKISTIADESIFDELGITRGMAIRVQGKRASGGSLTFNLYYAQILPFPLIRLVNLASGTKIATVLYIDGEVFELTPSGKTLYFTYQVRGEKLRILPHQYNFIFSFLGKEGNLSVSSSTLSYEVYVTPRWGFSS